MAHCTQLYTRLSVMAPASCSQIVHRPLFALDGTIPMGHIGTGLRFHRVFHGTQYSPHTPQTNTTMTANDKNAPPLVTFAFSVLCLFVFLAYCNMAVFYSLYIHLEHIDIPSDWRGLIIGVSSLSTITCFLAASPSLTTRNAPHNMYLGIGLLMACGMSYLFTNTVPGLMALRLVNGAGIYLLSASAMTLLVAGIPPSRSGQAFGLYSVAMLLPYCIIPTVFDWLAPRLPSLAWGYALMSLALLPAAGVNALLSRRMASTAHSAPPPERMRFADMLASVRKPSIGLLLLVNSVYYLSFSSLFFLAKGLFHSRGLENVGYFFSIQTFCMLVVRLLGNRIFDAVDKTVLVQVSYSLIAASFAAMYISESHTILYAAAFVLGLGMGIGAPVLNALMFGLSEPRFKGMNANLLMVSMHIGSFLGPILGGAAVNALGYGGFLLVGTLANLAGVVLSLPLKQPHRAEGGNPL